MQKTIKEFKEKCKECGINLKNLTLTRKFLRYTLNGDGVYQIRLLYWNDKIKRLEQIDQMLRFLGFKLNKTKTNYTGKTCDLDFLNYHFSDLKQLDL